MRNLYYFKCKSNQYLVPVLDFMKDKKKSFIESVENNSEILDEKSDENRRINASIITTRSHPQINNVKHKSNISYY